MMRFCSRLLTYGFIRHYGDVPSMILGNGLQQVSSRWVTTFNCNLYTFKRQLTVASSPASENSTEVSEIQLTPQIVSIYDRMQQFGFGESEIKQLITKQPSLKNTREIQWIEVIGVLAKNGFENEEILSILEKWPQVLYLKKNDLEKTLMSWIDSDLGEQLTFQVLSTHPQFLQVDHMFALKRCKQLQVYFESKMRVGKLFLLAPNILEENWRVLCDKLNYLDELCTDKSDIASSGVLAHSLFHVKARHEFLIRAGVYKRPTKHFRKRLSKNPKLEIITNTPDKEFVSNVAGLSMFEYDVFLEMYKKELENTEADDESDDETLYKLNYKKR